MAKGGRFPSIPTLDWEAGGYGIVVSEGLENGRSRRCSGIEHPRLLWCKEDNEEPWSEAW
jgi:hypothetical protein